MSDSAPHGKNEPGTPTKLAHGSAPATTAPHPATTPATRGRPVSRWTLKQHGAQANMAHLKWGPEDTKCDGCGSLLYRSYFTLQTDRLHGYRRFGGELEAFEVCADGAPGVPVLPVPPTDLRPGGKALVVNNGLSIAKRGTIGAGGNQRTQKVKHIKASTAPSAVMDKAVSVGAATRSTPTPVPATAESAGTSGRAKVHPRAPPSSQGRDLVPGWAPP